MGRLADGVHHVCHRTFIPAGRGQGGAACLKGEGRPAAMPHAPWGTLLALGASSLLLNPETNGRGPPLTHEERSTHSAHGYGMPPGGCDCNLYSALLSVPSMI